MIARRNLIYKLRTGGVKHAPDAVTLVDAFAHQLAEKQREHLRSQGYDTDCVCGSCSACLATEYIDLIDPECDEVAPPCQNPSCDLNLSSCVCGTPFGSEAGHE